MSKNYARAENDPPPALPFYTPAEIAAMARDEPDWIVHGLLAIGAITEIDGKIKAAGKTTFSLHMVRAIIDDDAFIGLAVRRTGVLYVTEQSPQTFADALRQTGLAGRGDALRVLFRRDFGGALWPLVVKACKQDGREVVVFDTLGKLSGIREENSAGEWSVAMAPLQDLAATGRAIVVPRHDRKGGGDVGDSGRGSSQASGDVDIILALRRPEGNRPGSRRVIESLSRYRETPEKMVIELTGSGYVMLGDSEAVARADALKFIRFLLTSELETKAFPVSGTDLIARVGHDRKLSQSSVRRALGELVASGELTVSGRGVKGDPHTYDRPVGSPGNDSSHTQIPKETNEPAVRNGGHLDPAAAFAQYLDESGGGMWSKLDETA